MKQSHFLLHSAEKNVSPSGIFVTGNGIRKTMSKTKFFKFPYNVQKSISSHKKWFTGEVKWLRGTTRKDFLYNGSFQEAIGSILVIAQCFGLMPVVGVKSKLASELRFKWISFRTFYSFVVFLLSLAYATMTVLITIQNDIQFDRIIPLVFYGSTVYGMICFGILATKWPRIMHQWETIEAKMPKYQTQQEKRILAYHVKMLSFTVLMSSLVEHTLNAISIVHFSKTCLRQDEPFEELFRVQLSQLFVYLPFSPLSAFLGKFVNIVATFFWNYMDLFIMILSIGLSSRFKQINKELQRVKGEHMSEEFWALRRFQYQQMCNLCMMIDNVISPIILLSFSNNLFFICVQLLKSIRPMISVPHAVYFWFSLLFLISRALAVSLYSSQIHDESKKPILVLRAVPNRSWGIEVQRFIEQVVNDTVALTGMRFFFLTRKLILSVAAAIFTYELVLIQFHTDEFQPVVCRNAS